MISVVSLRLLYLICECRCGAPGRRTARLGAGDPMWLLPDLAASACPAEDRVGAENCVTASHQRLQQTKIRL